VPALVATFQASSGAPDHAAYLHRGATSQDIIDTGLMLRLKDVLAILKTRLDEVLRALATQARRHAALPMAARTCGQAATPISFGAIIAGWGQSILRHRARLHDLRPEAQARGADLCRASGMSRCPLLDLASEAWPDLDFAALASSASLLGSTMSDALAFAETVEGA
jgi:Lyase